MNIWNIRTNQQKRAAVHHIPYELNDENREVTNNVT